MKIISALLAALFLLSMSFAQQATACNAGFDDVLLIRALDGKVRPIKDAQINLTYQKDYTTGKGYFNTKNFFTNENGTVSLVVKNVEQLQDRVDCDITIRGLYNNISTQMIVVANSHQTVIDMNFDAFMLTISVVDQKNEPIKNADVFVNELKKQTDESGIAIFPVVRGKARVLVSYGEGKVERTLDMQDDQLLSLNLDFFNMTLSIVDENLVPIGGVEISVDEKELTTPASGKLNFTNIFGSSHTVTAHYGAIAKSLDTNLVIEKDYTIIFDLNAPAIKSVKPEEKGNVINLNIVTKDEGEKASGVDSGAITVLYSVDSGTQEKATITVKTNSEYTASIPKPPPSSLLAFTVSVADKEGNKRIVDGRIKLPEAKPPETQPGDQPQSPIGFDIQVPPELIVGIIIVAVVIFFISRLKKDEFSS